MATAVVALKRPLSVAAKTSMAVKTGFSLRDHTCPLET